MAAPQTSDNTTVENQPDEYDEGSVYVAEPAQEAGPAVPTQAKRTPATVATTAGGVPAIPLAIITANTTVGALSATAVTGGPVMLATVAGIGATTAAVGAISTRRKRKASKGAKAVQAGSRAASTVPLAKRGTAAIRSAAGMPSATGRAVPRQARPLALQNLGRHRQLAASGSTAGAGASRSENRLGAVGRRAAAIQLARQGRTEAAPTHKARREQGTTDRRRVADARRQAREGARHSKARAIRDAAISKARKAADQRTAGQVAKGRRQQAEKGRELQRKPLKRQARRRRWASGARYWTCRALAAAVAAPIGLLGCITTPLGRKLGWRWLMWPGRRLHWRLIGTAKQARAERDQLIAAELAQALATDETAQAEEDRTIADAAPRAPRNHNAGTTNATGEDMSEQGSAGFIFDEAASDMETAAHGYTPDGALHVLQTIEGFPAALQYIANTFAVLAEKSDEEFPFDSKVGEAINEVYTILQTAVTAAEEAGKVFREVHEPEITRLEERRTNEQMWDTTNND